MPNKSAKPVPFATIVIEKQSSGAVIAGHRFVPGATYDLSPNLFCFDCPEALAGVLDTLATQYNTNQITLKVTVEAFLRVPSR